MTIAITKAMAKTGWIKLDKSGYLDSEGIDGIQLNNKHGVFSQIIETSRQYLLFCRMGNDKRASLIDINNKDSYRSMVCIAEDRSSTLPQ